MTIHLIELIEKVIFFSFAHMLLNAFYSCSKIRLFMTLHFIKHRDFLFYFICIHVPKYILQIARIYF